MSATRPWALKMSQTFQIVSETWYCKIDPLLSTENKFYLTENICNITLRFMKFLTVNGFFSSRMTGFAFDLYRVSWFGRRYLNQYGLFSTRTLQKTFFVFNNIPRLEYSVNRSLYLQLTRYIAPECQTFPQRHQKNFFCFCFCFFFFCVCVILFDDRGFRMLVSVPRGSMSICTLLFISSFSIQCWN